MIEKNGLLTLVSFKIGKLASKRFKWTDVVTMNVFVRDMNDFARINAIYKTFFDINPPTR